VLHERTCAGSTRHTCLQYSRMERSDENLPIRATLSIALRVHAADLAIRQ
jgi:hypothetical protein